MLEVLIENSKTYEGEVILFPLSAPSDIIRETIRILYPGNWFWIASNELR